MSWREHVRPALVTILDAVAITEPAALEIKRVYATPPMNIEDLPCFIIYPPARSTARGPATKVKMFTVRCRCLVSDEGLAMAADIIDAFAEAVDLAFDLKLKPGGAADPTMFINGFECTEAAAFQYPAGVGGRSFTGFDLILSLKAIGPGTFQA
jgi:hypothetical protein